MGIMHKNSTVTLSNPGASAETVVYTTPVIAIGPEGPPLSNPIDISGTFSVTPGTSTTAVVIRCRQGGLTGTQIGPAYTVTLAAGVAGIISYGFTDVSAYLTQAGGGFYVITAQQTAGTVAGVSNALDIKVMT